MYEQDLDTMIILAANDPGGNREKFIYYDRLLEVSYPPDGQFQSPDQVFLRDYIPLQVFGRGNSCSIH